jgi:hypothetical protein
MDIADIIKYQTIDLPCAQCGQRHPQTVAWYSEHDHLTCTCGESIPVNVPAYLKARHTLELHFQKYMDELSTLTGGFG